MKKTKYRQNTHDAMPLADVSAMGTAEGAPVTQISKGPPQPGSVPVGRLGIYNSQGQRVGHMGPAAGAPTASRFLKGAPAKLGKSPEDGRPAWIATRQASVFRTPNARHAHQLAQAKGSITKRPTAPRTSARPKR